MPGLLRRREDIKVFILYMLNLMDCPLEHNTLHDMCVQDNFVSSFDFMDCVADLCETGCVSTYKDDIGDDIYLITQKGVQVLSALEEDMLPLVRDKAMHSAIRLLSFEKSGGKVHVNYEKLDFGYKVNCEVEKNGKTLIAVSLNVATKSLVDRIEKKMRERPEEIYRGISALLLDDINLM